MATVPTPLPASSPKLRQQRYQADIARPSDKRPGSWIVHTTGRFVTSDDAIAWADATTKPGERYTLTYYNARDGWQAHAVSLPTYPH